MDEDRAIEIMFEAINMIPDTAERILDSGNYNLDDDEEVYLYMAEVFEVMAKNLRSKYTSNTQRN